MGPAHENVLADGTIRDGTLQPPYESASSGTLSIVESPTLFGQYAVKHEATGSDSYTKPYVGLNGAITDARQGQVWTGSVFVRAESGTPSVQLRVFALDGSGAQLDTSVSSVSASTGSWKRTDVTHTMPANTAFVSMRVDNDGGSGAIVYWSGFKLERGGTATGVSEGDLRLTGQLREV